MKILDVLLHDGSLRQQVQAHLHSQCWTQAYECLTALVAIDPFDAWAHQWLVVVAMALQPPQPQRALEAAQAALAALPPHAKQARIDVLFNQAQACGLLGQPVQALTVFDQLLALQPSHTEAILGRAKALAMLGQHSAAGVDVTQVVAMQPHNLEALALLGNTLIKANQPAKALQVFFQHERVKPAAPFVACMIVFLHRQLGQWEWPCLPVNASETDVLKKALAQGQPLELAVLAVRAWQNMPAIEPFASLVLYDDPALQRHVAQQFLQNMHPLVVPPAYDNVAKPLLSNNTASLNYNLTPVLKVAYVSCEFYEHATSFLLVGVLARHNPMRVQVVLLSYAPPPVSGKPDAMQQRIMSMGHKWVDVNTWTDAQVAQWCCEQGVDVAVDLKGLTRDSRPGIFAHRAAPVQVNWLGHAGTLSAPYYDWVLADAHVIPPELEPHFCERVWRLPHSYQPNDPDRLIDPAPQCRADHGLPLQGLVLVCFNNSFKFNSIVWAVWMRLLKARHDSVLWLLEAAPELQINLRQHAQSAGIAPERLVFAPKLAQAKHLARLQLADLSLDTYPYNAHTTASDALWAGVPHVACTGQSFSARVGASVLAAAGMPELVAYGLGDYEALAMRLLQDDDERLLVRKRLAVQRQTAPLWDAEKFAADLETAYEGMCSYVN
jgi:predicted O-linked N-acetylglucosamine transferase (SPINDLY family)